MIVKIINSSDPYIFEQDLQNLIDEYETQYNFDIQYQTATFINNNSMKINYSALIIMRRKINEEN